MAVRIILALAIFFLAVVAMATLVLLLDPPSQEGHGRVSNGAMLSLGQSIPARILTSIVVHARQSGRAASAAIEDGRGESSREEVQL